MILKNIKTSIKSKFPYSVNIGNYLKNAITRLKVALFDSFNINKTNAAIVFTEKAVKTVGVAMNLFQDTVPILNQQNY